MHIHSCFILCLIIPIGEFLLFIVFVGSCSWCHVSLCVWCYPCVVYFLWNFFCGNYLRLEMKVNSSNKDLLLSGTTRLRLLYTIFLI